mgnify:CR=1 FL=1
MEQKALKLIMAGLLILSMALTGREAAEYVGAMHAVNALRETGMGADDSGRLCVVVDAGHGGDDPGKIGINGAPEKDINLQIAQKLKKYLEAEDVEVVLTRETEDGLYDANASNKKVQDMKRRIEIIEKTDPVLTVSIHQNSYPDPAIKGAQVFYYTSSVEGKQLAKRLQERLVKGLDPQNHRQAKANDSYYLLKKTACPIVIVECGFLSNPQEEALLTDSVYQERVAWNIFMGIMQELKIQKE